ncbi:hypothetical protein [Sphingobium limneticum]|uniref:Uncharacterized protein n=1 Tax=Sphingobium limneticum TaxID=1007511 RepID=A0A5J5I4A0_9SPHN|nr:hypothetical protein [Sphingobium limneticum]KAA9018275.1 hypothetical protein F4U96_09190 [Sphingobium limneticum]KAA9030911.1 hypothetical protein F4U95_09140 [Sphingobium limneticum]
MSSKFNVSFNVDLSKYPEIAKAADPEAAARQVIIDTLLEPAKTHAEQELHRVRTDATVHKDEKAVPMADQLKAIMLNVMVEKNLEIATLPPGTAIKASFKLDF